MPARTPLSDSEIDATLPPGWRREADGDENWIARDFAFDDFRQAFAFLTLVAFEAEGRDHHPEITNVYDRVGLALSTHDAGNRVTETDLAFAQAVSEWPSARAGG
ncbi:4a-hydroxytetrahydrobiopterin dehydratase [Rubrivirga sp.]|uniref:4a-hydroxytetrahydrobiopterin dehydratase n=1 Tax=Rubrivirga sp. TaxID=1885344 RepID=UPI003B528B01